MPRHMFRVPPCLGPSPRRAPRAVRAREAVAALRLLTVRRAALWLALEGLGVRGGAAHGPRVPPTDGAMTLCSTGARQALLDLAV